MKTKPPLRACIPKFMVIPAVNDRKWWEVAPWKMRSVKTWFLEVGARWHHCNNQYKSHRHQGRCKRNLWGEKQTKLISLKNSHVWRHRKPENIKLDEGSNTFTGVFCHVSLYVCFWKSSLSFSVGIRCFVTVRIWDRFPGRLKGLCGTLTCRKKVSGTNPLWKCTGNAVIVTGERDYHFFQ